MINFNHVKLISLCIHLIKVIFNACIFIQGAFIIKKNFNSLA